MRCDVIATGVINAAKNIGLKKPIVIRLQGTNVEKANKLIADRYSKFPDLFNSVHSAVILISHMVLVFAHKHAAVYALISVHLHSCSVANQRYIWCTVVCRSADKQCQLVLNSYRFRR
jgi:hypothetical protein